MPKVLDEDRLRRKKALEEKRAERRRAKAATEKEDTSKSVAVAVAAANKSAQGASTTTSGVDATVSTGPQTDGSDIKKATGSLRLTDFPEDAIHLIFSMLTAAELGRLAGTCKALAQTLTESRTSIVVARCHRADPNFTGRVRYLDLCVNENEAKQILQDSYGGGDTGMILPHGKYAKKIHMDFCSYARYLQEATTGISYLNTGAREPIYLPRFVQGRFASVSPEHSLCRVGGDGKRSGAGGSGVAAWGVGKRGQLGHGKRRDERLPRRLLGGLGYGIRIVQVSAGGGLVRVAHSLLLTSTGRVLSFGMGQYGTLGHGYSAAKQLPDQLKPRYIEGLNGIRCVCVAAGELHSAVVTSDGDVWSWGDSFCGQCGHGDRRPQLTPRQVTAGGLEDEAVANISCGSRHTIAVTEEGQVYSWGLGHFGVLGRSFTSFDHAAEAAVAGLGVDGEDQAALNAGAAAIVPVVAAAAAVPPPPAAAAAPAGEGNELDAELMAHLDLIANLSLDDSSDQCIPKVVDALETIKVVGSSCGHRHSLFLDEAGALYSCGAGLGGCLGHGDVASQMYPMKITAFEDERIRIVQMSAGVDISMAVTSTGETWAWGKTTGGRIGLGRGAPSEVKVPRRVHVTHGDSDVRPIKAVDVECGYVHSIIVGLDGTIHMCGGVGVEGEDDGQANKDGEGDDETVVLDGLPVRVEDFNIWHHLPEPKEEVAEKIKYKKYGKYEIKGRSKMLDE